MTISSLRSTRKNEKRTNGATSNLHCRYDRGQCSLGKYRYCGDVSG